MNESDKYFNFRPDDAIGDLDARSVDSYKINHEALK